MKKALITALTLAFLLTACGETTLPDNSEQNPVVDGPEAGAPAVPDSCLLYYELGGAPVRAELSCDGHTTVQIDVTDFNLRKAETNNESTQKNMG